MVSVNITNIKACMFYKKFLGPDCIRRSNGSNPSKPSIDSPDEADNLSQSDLCKMRFCSGSHFSSNPSNNFYSVITVKYSR
jgi:hypothetical protein